MQVGQKAFQSVVGRWFCGLSHKRFPFDSQTPKIRASLSGCNWERFRMHFLSHYAMARRHWEDVSHATAKIAYGGSQRAKGSCNLERVAKCHCTRFLPD